MPRATRAEARTAARLEHVDESDYGSEFDEAALSELLVQAESQPLNPFDPPVLESIEEHNPLPRAALIPKPRTPSTEQSYVRVFVDNEGVPFEVLGRDGPIREPSVVVEYDESNRVAFSPRNTSENKRPRTVSVEPEVDDSRSPLERFRTIPKKPLSVTDIISPAWCELQYWYSLTKYGKVKKTPAMRQGSSVHKVLEEQVHTAVPVDVVSKEDAFGLRIWNIIQGLRTLRSTGMTREMEVWAVIEGQVVNGVIDEISYTCPDQELEDKIERRLRPDSKKKETPLPANQKTMESFFGNKSAVTAETSDEPLLSKATPAMKKVYITDIKTRGSGSVPKGEVSSRPTYMQLMMYHRLLGLLASNAVPAEQVFQRYRIDGEATFSDVFIAQIGGLDFHSQDTAGDGSSVFGGSQDSIGEILAHNTLGKLWMLMIKEFAQTLPQPVSNTLPPETISPIGHVLRAEFRATGSGAIIGSKKFEYDIAALNSYIKQEMAWWNGERKARGVDIEEAFKCRICEFAASCAWRKEKVEDGIEKSRLRRQGRKKSEV